MRFVPFIFLSLTILIGSASCGKEVKGLEEEIKILKEENGFLKAENIVLKRELDEVYNKLEEKEKAGVDSKMKHELIDSGKSRAEAKPAARPDLKIKNGHNKVRSGDDKKHL
ncbi:MAG: hypothetical protein LBQ00_06635 [Syntrophobacterales bacterium]|jgi:regulator of replication initiation timing|nr:hypothetical protein [Syntrophobacterales bacterium]